MRIEKGIVSAWAGILTQAAVRDAIAYLQTLDDDLALFEDFQLTVWDSVCIQVRGEHTAFWDAYQSLIDSCLSSYIESQGDNERLALWAQTDEGQDWVYDHYADENGRNAVPLDESAILIDLRAAVLVAADADESEVVDRFLYGARGGPRYLHGIGNRRRISNCSCGP